jgi:predicted RNA-binding Zn-ribbon protein involved in translation (DUF1610 family)
MKFNNKKLEKSSKLINYSISIILSIFLISLANKFIGDVNNLRDRPYTSNFENSTLIDSLNKAFEGNESELQAVYEKKSSTQTTINIARNNYTNAKESFDNWLRARETVGSPTNDEEVLKRANELDEYYKAQQAWEKELQDLNDKVEEERKVQAAFQMKISEEKERARAEYDNAIKKYNLNVFLTRLLIVLPILLLGVFFIFKFRKHKYWPLFLGYVLFSFYAFFFGLVPYLPSYGGYIRYSVGIILSIVFGIYAINRIRSFIEKKKRELEISSSERAKKVQTETAEKALDNHMCPSCGKDFIIKRWDNVNTDKLVIGNYGKVSNFCRHCGLELFKNCKSCDTKNYAHLPFCSNCGDEVQEKEEAVVS